MSKVFWFDTETTGTDPVKNDIVQISGIISIDRDDIETFDLKCRPHNPENISEKALEVTGLSKEEIMSYHDPVDMWNKLSAILSKHVNKYQRGDRFIPAGHNSLFDIRMLGEHAKKCNDSYGIGSYMLWQPIDTMVLSVVMKSLGIINPANMKLKTVCDSLGIELDAHDALNDIIASKKIYDQFILKMKEC